MVISARLPTGAALIPRIGRRDRDKGPCGPTPAPYVGPYTAGLSGKHRSHSPRIISSPVTTPRLNQTLPDLQTAQTLPDLIGCTAPTSRSAPSENCYGATDSALTDSIESDSSVQEITKHAYVTSRNVAVLYVFMAENLSRRAGGHRCFICNADANGRGRMGRRGRQLAEKRVDPARRAVISEWDRWASRRLPTGYKATGDDE